MEKEIKSYLNYVKTLPYSELVSEGKKYWHKILESAKRNNTTAEAEEDFKLKSMVLFDKMYFATISGDAHIDSKEIKLVAEICDVTERDVEKVFDEIRNLYYEMNFSEKAAFLVEMNKIAALNFKTRDDMISLFKIIALVMAVDNKINFSEKVYLKNAIKLLKDCSE